MSEFVKKTITGYRAVKGGYSDPECSHVILTQEEYDKLLKKISFAEQTARITKDDAEKTISAVKREADRQIQENYQKTAQTIEEWRAALEAEQAKSAYQRSLNENLLRIAKERANADRKLKPKKEHTGYVVAFSGEKEYHYRDGRKPRRKLLWETVIQSPYTMDCPEQIARKQISEKLLQSDEDGLIKKIGIDALYGGRYETMMDDRKWCAEPGQYNIMLKPTFRANFRSGYWETSFFHTKPLGVVPWDMRLR